MRFGIHAACMSNSVCQDSVRLVAWMMQERQLVWKTRCVMLKTCWRTVNSEAEACHIDAGKNSLSVCVGTSSCVAHFWRITREGGCILDLKTKDLAKSPSLLRMEGSWLLHAVMHSDYWLCCMSLIADFLSFQGKRDQPLALKRMCIFSSSVPVGLCNGMICNAVLFL